MYRSSRAALKERFADDTTDAQACGPVHLATLPGAGGAGQGQGAACCGLPAAWHAPAPSCLVSRDVSTTPTLRFLLPLPQSPT